MTIIYNSSPGAQVTISGGVTDNRSGLLQKYRLTAGTELQTPAAGKRWIVICMWCWNDGGASQIDIYLGAVTAVAGNQHSELLSTATPPMRSCEIIITEADCIRLINNAGFSYYEV